MEQKNWLVKTGDFFFKYRNMLFPLLLLTLFLSYRAPHEYNGSEQAEEIKDFIAEVIVFLGLALRSAVIGYKYIKRGGLNKKVYAEKLVTDGFFGLCRNPLYVGNLIIYFGVLLMHGSPMVIVLGMVFFLFVYTAIVSAEEFFLRKEFGEAYAEYCRDVPRWGIKFWRFREATEGMHFNLKRALVKDYSTIANAIVSLTFLEFLEDEEAYTHADDMLFAAIVGTVVVVALAIRIAKRRGMLVA